MPADLLDALQRLLPSYLERFDKLSRACEGLAEFGPKYPPFDIAACLAADLHDLAQERFCWFRDNGMEWCASSVLRGQRLSQAFVMLPMDIQLWLQSNK